MTAKFISTVLRAASVVAVPLAMLAASTPAGAQRPDQRNQSEWHYGNGHYKGKNRNYKNGHYKYKNRNDRNGYYKHGRDHDDYNNDRNNNDRYNNDRDGNGRYNNGRYPNGYPNGYPARGATRYPSSPVIPGFPVLNAPSGRAGKTLPGTNQQYQRNNSRYHGH